MDWVGFSGGQYSIAQWLFARGLGLCYFFAFFSLLLQIKSLWSAQGLEPIQSIMHRYRESLGKRSFFRVPTIFWLSSSDQVLYGTAALGLISSFLVMINSLTVSALIICYFSYLSFCALGSRFLNYQWDTLLLEVGFAGIFFLWGRPASPLWLMVMWLILFRFMLCSGLVKLQSRDQTWKSLTALQYHFETQPLPTYFAWYVHQLSPLLLKWACLAMFMIEIIAPFGIFSTPVVQFFVFFLFTGLMCGISLTGNYCFFNILTVTLSLLLIEDRFLQPFFGAGFVETEPTSSMLGITFLLLVGAILGTLNVLALIDAIVPGVIPRHYQQFIAPFRICNHYGLFAVMTTERKEIIIEGSWDKETWEAYEFKWKPGALNERPSFVAPHQPRLDWQMWFAALGDHRSNPWLLQFMGALLQNKSSAVDLLKHNPFSDKAPTYIRARLFRYRFTDPETREQTGEWWQRELLGNYTPVIQLHQA